MKMKYLLDTSIIAFLFRKSYNIGNRLRELDSDQCYVSEITIQRGDEGLAVKRRRKERGYYLM